MFPTMVTTSIITWELATLYLRPQVFPAVTSYIWLVVDRLCLTIVTLGSLTQLWKAYTLIGTGVTNVIGEVPMKRTMLILLKAAIWLAPLLLLILTYNSRHLQYASQVSMADELWTFDPTKNETEGTLKCEKDGTLFGSRSSRHASHGIGLALKEAILIDDEDGLSTSQADDWVDGVIEEVRKLTPGDDREERRRLAMFVKNLRRVGNQSLRKQILEGQWPPAVFAALQSPHNLAPENMRKKREENKERYYRGSVIVANDAEPVYRKTHKGLERVVPEVEDEAGPEAGDINSSDDVEDLGVVGPVRRMRRYEPLQKYEGRPIFEEWDIHQYIQNVDEYLPERIRSENTEMRNLISHLQTYEEAERLDTFYEKLAQRHAFH